MTNYRTGKKVIKQAYLARAVKEKSIEKKGSDNEMSVKNTGR